MEQKNEHLHIPYQQLPAYKLKEIKTYCQEYGHRDQKNEYLILTQQSSVIKTRLVCIKCINALYSNFKGDIALLQDVLADSLNAFKHTKFQGNILQEFSDLYHSLNFNVSKDDIEFKFASFQKQILHLLEQCKKDVLKSYKNYQELKKKLADQIEKFQNVFDFSEQEEALSNYAKCKSPNPKDQQNLNESLNKYVKKLHEIQNDRLRESLKETLIKFKQNINDFTQKNSCFHMYKLDQGMLNVEKSINEMKKTFSPNYFTQSKLSNDYIMQVFQNINKEFQEISKIEKVKPIYYSVDEGLSYKNLLKELKKSQQSLLFIFQTTSSQTFGAFIDKQPSNDKQPTNDKQPNFPHFDRQPSNDKQPNFANFDRQPTIDRQSIIDKQRQRSLLFQLNKQQIYPIKTQVSPIIINEQANDNSMLLQFGNCDLVIQSNFKQCYSKLGSGFDASEYKIGDLESHLANAQEFQIAAIEIFQFT